MEKNNFLYQKIAIHLSQVFMKDILATGEASSPQKTTSSTSKHEISFIFLFYPPGSGSVSAFLDMDSVDQNHCGSGSGDPQHWGGQQ
jgi:hypothetical protein